MALPDGVYPNNLRASREALYLSRKALAELCAQLADKDHVRFTAVGESTINHLERGKSQPRGSTAMTLATVLRKQVSEIFPEGVDVKNRLVD